MTAETIDNNSSLPLAHPEAAGFLAMSTLVGQPETVDSTPDFILLPAQRKKHDARQRSTLATLMKERFQSVVGPTADERDSQRRRARETGVRLMFKTFGQLPKVEGAEEAFSQKYRETENQLAQATSEERMALWERISEAWDADPTHPAMLTLDTLRSMSTVDPEDILFMRRTALLLMADHTESA